MAPNQSRTMKVKPAELGVRRAFEVHSHVLHNGMKILLVENPSLPTVSLNASVLTGKKNGRWRKLRARKTGLRLWQAGHSTNWCTRIIRYIVHRTDIQKRSRGSSATICSMFMKNISFLIM